MSEKYTDEQVEFLIRVAQASLTGLTSYLVQSPETKVLINLTSVEAIIRNIAGLLTLGLQNVGFDFINLSVEELKQRFDELGEELDFFNTEAYRSRVENDLRNPPEVDADVWGDW